jgi:hypothetical protein
VAQNYTEFDFTGKKILVVDDEVELNTSGSRSHVKNADARSSIRRARDRFRRKGKRSISCSRHTDADLNGWDVVKHFKTRNAGQE